MWRHVIVVLLVLGALAPPPAPAADNVAAGPVQFCFSRPDAEATLRLLDEGRECAAYILACDAEREALYERTRLLDARIAEQDERIRRAEDALGTAERAAEQAAKAAKGTWWEATKDAMVKVGIGVVLGFVLSLSL